jgi:methionine-R-sulfoxide reductase
MRPAEAFDANADGPEACMAGWGRIRLCLAAVAAAALSWAVFLVFARPGWVEAALENTAGRASEELMADTTVTVRLIGADGRLTEPVAVPRVVKRDEEWRRQLTPEQYRITRGKGTERPFCGRFHDHKQPGRYDCVGCALPLFDARAKFDSGTGWPSFFRPVAFENIRTETDASWGMVREEILCARCGAHLGHVFDDGPPPTGRRYCLNSEALTFVPGSPPPQP